MNIKKPFDNYHLEVCFLLMLHFPELLYQNECAPFKLIFFLQMHTCTYTYELLLVHND